MRADFALDRGLSYELSMLEVTLCKACLKDSNVKPKKFRKRLAKELGCEVELSSCLKICPREGLGFAVKVSDGKQLVRAVRTFVREPELDRVADEVRSLSRP